jgi:hypothetical protein
MKNPNLRAPAATAGNRASQRRALRRTLLGGLPLGLLPLTLLPLTLFIGGCSSGTSAGETNLAEGSIHVNPQTGTKFVVESNRGGSDASLRITKVFWGRLVDVYDEVTFVDPVTLEKSFTNTLQFEDFVVGDNIQSSVDYRLERNAVTEKENLIIRHPEGTAAYMLAFQQLEKNTQPLLDKALGDLPPFTAMPRNAAMVVVFQDLLDHETINSKTIIMTTGYPPGLPFEARLVPDMTHGDLVLVGGKNQFRTTRVLVDLTVSKIEAQNTNPPLPVNSLGLPEAQVVNQANVVVRFPTQTNSSVGQFDLLRNLNGRPLSFGGNGSTDPSAVTADVVRAFRSSSPKVGDPNNGFLVDKLPPRVVGIQAVRNITVVDVGTDPSGKPIYEVDFTYNTLECATTPQVSDVLALASHVAVVTELANPPTGGLVTDARMRLLAGDADTFVTTAPSPSFPQHSQGEFNTVYRPAGAAIPECFLQFSLSPTDPPQGGVNPQTSVSVLFSEPMDPASVQAFDSFEIHRTELGTPILQRKIVGRVVPSLDLRKFTFVPTLPFTHAAGSSENYDVVLFSDDNPLGADTGIVDLAGNAIEELLPNDPGGVAGGRNAPRFSLDASQPAAKTGGQSLNFSKLDEDGDGFNELRGQVLYDLQRGVLKPRPVTRFSAVGDASKPIVGAMVPFTAPIQTPLSNYGSKLHYVFRYADLGLGLTDESSHNIDVEFMHWAPFEGIQIDNYSEFQILLCHSFFLPDEFLNTGLLPSYPFSGLVKTYDDNLLDPVLDPQKVVHPKPRGYTVQPLEAFFATTGTLMMPWPMNRADGAPIPAKDRLTFTWRDTGITAVGGPGGAGADLARLAQIGAASTPNLFPANLVPTVALPLLTEIRCYPDDGAIGLNGFKINLAINSSSRPNFRAFSTGGVLTNGTAVKINPDNHPIATSGINPNTGVPLPPGTEVDNSFYVGQVDFVVRVSRAHTIWLDAGAVTKQYAPAVVEPSASLQPGGTAVTVAFRGATTVTGSDRRDATKYNFYGNPIVPGSNTNVTYLAGDSKWKDDPNQVAGAPFFQLRLSLISNPDSTLTPEVSAVGVAYSL